MNRVFSIIWSTAQRAWVVASELASGRRREGGAVGRRLVVSGFLFKCDAVETLPLASPLRLSILLALLAPNLHVRAIEYHWDTDGATAGAGGATPGGTWSAGGTTLSTDANGATATGTVVTTTADRVFFSVGTNATGSYTITVNGTQNIGRLTFQEGTVNLTGGTINFGGASGVIDGDGTPDTVSAVITGTNGVRHSGGTRTLTGTNTYTGTTQVGGAGLNQATLILASPGGNAVSGSFLQLGGNNYTSAGFLTLGAANQISDTATVQLNSGHYSGSSVFSLNGFDETIGGINLHHQGNASSVTFRNGAATDATVTLVGSGTYTTASGDRVTGRVIQDGAAGRLNVVVALTGAGNQTFSGQTPRYTGTTTVSSGTLRLWNTSLWASNAILSGGTLQLHQTLAAPVTAGGNAPSPRTHANTIGGTGGTLRKTGDSIVILSGANTYRGATAIEEGTLRAGSATAFGSNSAVTLANIAGATMDLNDFNIGIGSLAGGGATGGNVTLGFATLTTGGNNTDTTYAGNVSGSGGLTKTGSGTQILSGTNAYTGGTTISSGSLQLGDGGTSGTIVGDVVNNGTLAFNRSDAFTFAGGISGAGAVRQIGSGTTVLTANSNYTGGTTINAGTLQLGNGGGAGSIVGDVVNHGTMAFNRSNTLAFGGMISGGGAVNQIGSGTMILTANNTYTGGTIITNGSLHLGDGGTSGSIAGDVVNNGTLAFDRSDAFTLAGEISGAGAVRQIGSGTTVLTANSNYTGGTTIDAGTLQVGNGGSTGSIVGDVINNGTMAFNRSDASTFAGLISGSGAVRQIGSGTTILTGDNTYGGGSVIEANSRLQIGDGGTTGALGTGPVILRNNAWLIFDRSNTYTFDGAISSTGTTRLIQNGDGVTVLNNANNVVSGTTISSGTLVVGDAAHKAARLTSNVLVAANGMLGGHGIVSGNVDNSGTVAPGTSIGTLTISGNYVGGGRLAIETVLGGSDSPTDRLVIDGGTATGVSVLAVTNLGGAGALTTGDGILVVDAVNGGTTAANAFALSGRVSAGPYDYTLFRGSTGGSNTQAWYLRSTVDCNAAPTVPACATVEQIPNYRPETSLYAALPAMVLTYGRQLIDTLHERAGDQRQGYASPASDQANGHAGPGWARVVGITGTREGNPGGVLGSGPRYEYKIAALQGGFDLYRAMRADGGSDQAGLYAAIGRNRGEVTHFDGRVAGTDTVEAYTLGGHWTHLGASGWYLDGVAQLAWNRVRAASQDMSGLKTSGASVAVSLEGGYPFPVGSGITVEPQAQLVRQKAWLEDSADSAASVRFRELDSLAGRVGVRFAHTQVTFDANGTQQRRVAMWMRPSLWYEFRGAPVTEFSSAAGYIPFHADGGGAFAEIVAGLDVQITRNASVHGNVSYQGALDGRSDAYGGKFGVRVSW